MGCDTPCNLPSRHWSFETLRIHWLKNFSKPPVNSLWGILIETHVISTCMFKTLVPDVRGPINFKLSYAWSVRSIFLVWGGSHTISQSHTDADSNNDHGCRTLYEKSTQFSPTLSFFLSLPQAHTLTHTHPRTLGHFSLTLSPSWWGCVGEQIHTEQALVKTLARVLR